MKLYADLKLKGINTSEEFETTFKNIFNLDDIHFNVPSKDGCGLVSLHLDFENIEWYFNDKERVLTINLKTLAETWVNLNLDEDSYDNSEITTELLKKGFVENYVLFLERKDGTMFTDIKIERIGYMDNNDKPVLFKISDEAINEADF